MVFSTAFHVGTREEPQALAQKVARGTHTAARQNSFMRAGGRKFGKVENYFVASRGSNESRGDAKETAAADIPEQRKHRQPLLICGSSPCSWCRRENSCATRRFASLICKNRHALQTVYIANEDNFAKRYTYLQCSLLNKNASLSLRVQMCSCACFPQVHVYLQISQQAGLGLVCIFGVMYTLIPV